jgi:hypothetical protein
MTRERLPHRRGCLSFSFECEGLIYRATFSLLMVALPRFFWIAARSARPFSRTPRPRQSWQACCCNMALSLRRSCIRSAGRSPWSMA